MVIEFQRVAAPEVPWDELDRAPDRTVGQTRGWLDFLHETQRAETVIARICERNEHVGWFTGAIVRRGPLRILGSPLRGWSTAAMGFNLATDVDRVAVITALPAFAFGELRCAHVEVADRALTDDQVRRTGLALDPLPGWQLDLQRGDDDLLASMRPNGRRDVRRALRNGIVVEEVDPLRPGSFADDYYAQVREAFAKRRARPRYGPDRVEALLRHLSPTNDLIVLRARTPDGELAATGVFPGRAGSTAEFWMGASAREHQALLPNEALIWAAMRAWRDRGAVRFDLGGGGPYKAKYGGTPHVLARLHRSRLPALSVARSAAVEADRQLRLRRARRAGT